LLISASFTFYRQRFFLLFYSTDNNVDGMMMMAPMMTMKRQGEEKEKYEDMTCKEES